MREYAKAFIALLGIAATRVASWTDPNSNINQVAATIIGVLTILGVYSIKNKTTPPTK